ncbi:chaperone NapD [Granulosicoccus sp. 3-233]|uniref:chaperone NapD n=1 Tax=Granulosicoccus sp. 3-233 TaxID=3417969 RepID=UPI003D356DB2
MNIHADSEPGKQRPSAELHIASLVIFARPDCRNDTIDYLNNIPACTLYTEESRAALVVVVEVDHQQQINSLMDELNARTGILSVNLVYHHVDSEHSMKQEMNP